MNVSVWRHLSITHVFFCLNIHLWYQHNIRMRRNQWFHSFLLSLFIISATFIFVCLRPSLCFRPFIAACLPDAHFKSLETFPEVIFMRINSRPISYLCLSFFVISSDLPTSFQTPLPPPPCVASSTLWSLLLHLYCTCLSNALVISGVLFILHPHPPSPSLSKPILPQSLFFYGCLLLTPVYHSSGASQSRRRHFIM